MLKTIWNKIYRVDYLAHFIAGAAGLEGLFTLCHIFKANVWWYVASIILMILVVFSKDIIYDLILKKGTFEWFDIIMGFSGIIFIVIQWLLLLI